MIVNYNNKKHYFGIILFLSIFSFSFGQTLLSDKEDYYPGELATFTGSGFSPNELIDLVVLHHDETPNSGENHNHWEVQTDENGSFITTWIVCTDDCLGSTLKAYATGLSSHLQAWVEFTDANVKFSFSGISGYTGNITLNYRVYPTGSPSGSFTTITISYLNPNSMTSIAVLNSQTIQYNTNPINIGLNSYSSTPSSNVGANNGNGLQTIVIPFNLTCIAPTITCPSNTTTTSGSTSCGKSLSFTATASGTSPTITYKIGSTPITFPYNFPLGPTTVTATATNSCGSSSCNFIVIVDDVTAPIVPTLSNITGECSATVSIPNTTDTCAGNILGTTSNPLTYTSQGTFYVNWTFDDGNGNVSNAIQTVIVDDVTAPMVICPLDKLNLTTNLGSCTITLTSNEIGIATGNDNCLNPTINWTRSDNSSNINDPFTLGITTITWNAIDIGNNQVSCSQKIEVSKIAPTLLVSTSLASLQYSDLLSFYAQLSFCSGYPTSGSVTFKLGTTILGSVSINSSGYAQLLNVPMTFAPNSYIVTAEYNGVLPYLATTGTSNLTITCEDANVYYTGSSYVSTSSATSSSATITLSATIKDISAVDTNDINFGNITNAKVTFINRDNNSVIAANIPIGLVTIGDTKVGTATYNWNTSISGDSQSITIGVLVTGYYCRDTSNDNEVVTISKPLGDLFITGGGYLILNSSSGIKAGSVGTKNNYGFNVKYNKNRTSLQGNINTIIRKMESDGLHVYQVKGNSMTSLSVITTCPKKAVFVGKANIQDITNPLNIIALDGNATLQVTITDNGEPGNFDKIAITVWNKNGGLWFSSNWNGTTTVEQTISGGNLKVHGGSNCGNTTIVNTTNSTITTKNTAKENSTIEKPEITIWPNPSNTAFNLEMSNKIENQEIEIEIFDLNGKLVQKSTSTHEKVNFGTYLQSGLYLVKITHGNFIETKRVLKN